VLIILIALFGCNKRGNPNQGPNLTKLFDAYLGGLPLT